jgi:hypothetical protein
MELTVGVVATVVARQGVDEHVRGSLSWLG